jgi:hypothetical protein
MRWLKISYVLSRAGRPILLSATLLGACAGSGKAIDAPGSGAPDAIGDLKHDVQVIVIPLRLDGGSIVTPDARLVPSPSVDASALPLGGCLDIDAGVDAGLALGNSQAARVTMEWSGGATGAYGTTSLGHITIAPEIAGLVVGMPTVEVTSKSPDSAADPSISNLRADKDGFAFDVVWSPSGPGEICMIGVEPNWIFRTALRLQCGGQERVVESFTVVAICGGYSWASSGDRCDECAVVCEMAPSPIVPRGVGDALPLGSALSVVIRPLVRVGGTLVLLANHAPRDGLAYAWQVSAGTIEQLDRDVVLWRLPCAGKKQAHIAQVAVTGEDLAAVASFRWDRPAA